jgi:hypothetical protein
LSKNTGGCKIIKFVFFTISSVLISDLIIFWQILQHGNYKRALQQAQRLFGPLSPHYQDIFFEVAIFRQQVVACCQTI